LIDQYVRQGMDKQVSRRPFSVCSPLRRHCLEDASESHYKAIIQAGPEPVLLLTLPLDKARLVKLEIDALAKNLSGRKPALLGLGWRCAEQLPHCRVRHACKRRCRRFDAVKSVEGSRLAQTLHKIHTPEPRSEITGNLRRNDAQIGR